MLWLGVVDVVLRFAPDKTHWALICGSLYPAVVLGIADESTALRNSDSQQRCAQPDGGEHRGSRCACVSPCHGPKFQYARHHLPIGMAHDRSAFGSRQVRCMHALCVPCYHCR